MWHAISMQPGLRQTNKQETVALEGQWAPIYQIMWWAGRSVFDPLHTSTVEEKGVPIGGVALNLEE